MIKLPEKSVVLKSNINSIEIKYREFDEKL